ncbi:MAG: hypothetical protein QY307_02245 [Acidimicrobiia bacterium]|nr:MAG: hypothetical protein QY307_02245 [Acidimicrobiia bacterium]
MPTTSTMEAAVAWEYSIKQFATTERWTDENRIAEIKRLEDYANRMGGDGWEFVALQPVPTHPVGHVLVSILRRPAT